MDRNMQHRGVMAAFGGLSGLSLYLLVELVERDILPDRLALAAVIFAAVFFNGVLSMAGPLRLLHAAIAAAGVAVGVAALVSLAGLRFARVDDLFSGPLSALAGAVLATLPLPFLIAARGEGWRDYPTLFAEAWGIVVRVAAAWVFTGMIWAVLLLSNALLSLVGVDVIERLIDISVVPWLVTGTALGLALAVVHEMADYVSPYLILRLLRLLLPVVLVVLVVFILALPVQGLGGLFGSLSAAATLLAMSAAAATLVTTAIDRNDFEATESALMARATQALALILPLPAALAGYAVWLRVDQYGWTPARLFAALSALVALTYGLLYVVAVLRRAGWMERIRQSNTTMALVLVALAALWLTPVLDAERISANSQRDRILSGRANPESVDPRQFADWGKAGEAALATLRERAAAPGQEALARALSREGGGAPDSTAARAALRAALPVRPAGAGALKDRVIAALGPDEVDRWLASCRETTPDEAPGCVLVVADLWPATPGDEAVAALVEAGSAAGYLRYEGFVILNGDVQRRSVMTMDGYPPYEPDGLATLHRLQGADPVLQAVPLNQFDTGDHKIFLQP